MKPAAFDYFAPETEAEALALLARHGPDARLLAGGQSLVPLMNARALRPAVLIDLNRLPGLAGIALADNGDLVIGSMTRQRALEREPLVRRELPALAEALPCVGFPQTRNRGTLGGSLAHADPAAELPALALAYGASLRIRSARGERAIPAAELFVGSFATTLTPDELLASISFPAAGRAGGAAFAETARRQSHRAEAGAVARVELAADGTIGACELTLFGVADRPVALP
ncbi:MAG TPA: FAD binding domain-containing protein, partial [Herpetosiphonaceae bacterium]